MNNPSQYRSWIPGIRGRATGAALALTILLGLAIVAAPSAQAQTFTTFDATGAATAAPQGTFPISINATGEITGFCLVGSGLVAHGFVRTASGALTTLDALDAGSGGNQGTFLFSINAAGEIVGMSSDGSNLYHGFVRTAGGTISTYEAPDASLAGHNGTTLMGVNTLGAVTGFYRDDSALYHGLLLPASGPITTFEVPAAGTGAYAGTEPLSINAGGVITGFYVISYVPHAPVYHGFVRAANGSIKTFDSPGTGSGNYKGILPISINSAGVIAGAYGDTNGRHGFVRATNGTITTFDAPGAAAQGWIQGTAGVSIDDAGDVAGMYTDTNAALHGFVRAANGVLTPIDVPGAGTAGLFQGTVATGINAAGIITGAYTDTSGVFHGFVLTGATPSLAITNLSAEIASPSVGLSSSETHSLNAKLRAAQAYLQAGDTADAINVLQSFINAVSALVKSHRLAAATAAPLLSAAQSIIARL